MGNRFGKKQVVEQVNRELEEVERLIPQPCKLRIKVRMSPSQLKELMTKADISKDNAELCRLIMQECAEGRLTATTVKSGQVPVQDHARKTKLDTISEEEN